MVQEPSHVKQLSPIHVRKIGLNGNTQLSDVKRKYMYIVQQSEFTANVTYSNTSPCRWMLGLNLIEIHRQNNQKPNL
jgi:hypothetical protein